MLDTQKCSRTNIDAGKQDEGRGDVSSQKVDLFFTLVLCTINLRRTLYYGYSRFLSRGRGAGDDPATGKSKPYQDF